MESAISIGDVLSRLEERAGFHREQEALHAQQEAHHREQRSFHAGEREKLEQNLEAFRSAAAAAVDLAGSLPTVRPAEPAAIPEQDLPSPGRLMAGRLVKIVVQGRAAGEPFGPRDVAEEANRRFADRLPQPIGSRAASDVLRRLLAEGRIERVRPGKASHEALYVKKVPVRG